MTATLSIRPFEIADLRKAVELEIAAYSEPWSESTFIDELRAPGRLYLAADVGGALVGYGGLMVIGREAHITTLVVDGSRRQAGIGTKLMLALVEAGLERGATSLTLEVRQSNVSAQALYRRFGMSPVGVRKNYYQDEDALIMWAHDIDGPSYATRLEIIVRSQLGPVDAHDDVASAT